MSKFKVELNRKGVREMLRSQSMMNAVTGIAEGIATRAGSGYEVDNYVGRNRVNASVRTRSREAVHDNAKNNTLLKAMK